MSLNPPTLPELRALLRAQPPQLRQALIERVNSGLDSLRKPEPIPLPLWAHRHFYLSAESSLREERWRAWPFQIGLLHCMGDDSIQEFDFFKSARLGYTKCLLASIAYTAEHQRRNQAVWQPTDADSDDFCKTDLEPMLRDVTVMRRVFPRQLRKSKLNSLKQKKFLGSILKLRGGASAGNYRRLTLQKATADELDGFEQSVEKAGTPDALIRKRTEGATWPKIILGSTGRKKHLSHIERCFNEADVRLRWHITCPHCDADHPLQWGGKDKPYGFKWDAEDPENTARHLCPHCHGAITQGDYLRLQNAGFWLSECGTYKLIHGWHDNGEPWARFVLASDGTPCLPPRRVGAHAWTAISPMVLWGTIVREFLNAVAALRTGDSAPMVAWVNETQGETWEEANDKADASALQLRAQASGYLAKTVPQRALVAAAGVDVQDDRFEIVVWAQGRDAEMWAIDYIVLDVNPADPRDWDALYQVLREPYLHASGAWVSLSGAAVDTGGHFTHQAYAFVHKYQDRSKTFRLYAIKGSSNEGDPIKARNAKFMDINLKGRVIKKGVKLWMVGTDTARDLFHGRLKLPRSDNQGPTPGYVHFASDLPSSYFKQFENEKRIPVKTQTRTVHRWVHFQGRNEVPDGTVYALFVFAALGVEDFSDHKWRAIERQLQPTLFDMPVPDPTAPALPAPPSAGLQITATSQQQPPTQVAATPPPTAPRPAPSPFAPSDWLDRGFQ